MQLGSEAPRVKNRVKSRDKTTELASESEIPHLSPAGVIWRKSPPGLESAKILVIPTESLFVSVVDLPLKWRNERLCALPFAIEEDLGQPLSDVHAVLGPEVDENRYLAVAIDKALMSQWLEAAKQAGLDQRKFVPDFCFIQIPPEGSWACSEADGRVVARLPDGSGFAAEKAQFEQLHQLAGSPEISDISDFSGTSSDFADLRQGAFARADRGVIKFAKLAAGIAAIGLALHTALAGIDLLALRSVAAEREAVLIAEFAAKYPETPPGTELIPAVDRMILWEAETPREEFLTLLSEISTALVSGPQAQFRELAFDSEGEQLSITLEASDLAALQSVGTALESNGIGAVLGTARTIPGGAEGRFTIASRGAR